MRIELLAEIAAVALAGTAALTDMVWGKVFNRVIGWGLIAAAAGLMLIGTWRLLGLPTDLDAFPELGTFYAAVAEAPLPPAPEPATWGHDDSRQVSVLPRGSDTGDASAHDAAQINPTFLNYLGRVAVNAALAFVVGFGLWWFGMWAAGDAKLYAVLAALIPLGTYAGSFWPFFPAYVILFNTFLALMSLLVLELVVRFVRQAIRPTEEEVEAWKTAGRWIRGHWKDMVIGFVGILFLFLVIKTLRMLTRDVMTGLTTITSSTLVFFLLFVLFHPLVKLMRKPWFGWPVVAATLGFVVWVTLFPTDHYNLRTVLHVSALMLGLVFFLLVYELYLNVFDFKPLRIWELRPRMILARKTTEILKEDQDLLEHKMGPVGPDGMSVEQVDTLRRWWIDRGKGGRIWVSRTIPFAPALFLGTLATVLLKGYLVWLHG